MHYRLLLLVGLLTTTALFGQESNSKVVVSKEIEALVALKKEINTERFANDYYAIQLYYGNYTAAKRLVDEFLEKYPTWEAEVVFETPNYKVRAGHFKELSEAQQKLEEIRKEYPSAFLLEPNNL